MMSLNVSKGLGDSAQLFRAGEPWSAVPPDRCVEQARTINSIQAVEARFVQKNHLSHAVRALCWCHAVNGPYALIPSFTNAIEHRLLRLEIVSRIRRSEFGETRNHLFHIVSNGVVTKNQFGIQIENMQARAC